MKTLIKDKVILSAISFFVMFLFCLGSVQAASTSVAILNMQQVLAKSKAGVKAQKEMEKKLQELQKTFKQDEEKLLAMQKDIEKKSSAWSDEIKQEKAIEFQKKRRDLRVKQEDANLEMKQLREQQLGPLLKVLEQVVADVAKAKGHAVVIPRSSVLYSDKSVEITDDVIKALDSGKK